MDQGLLNMIVVVLTMITTGLALEPHFRKLTASNNRPSRLTEPPDSNLDSSNADSDPPQPNARSRIFAAITVVLIVFLIWFNYPKSTNLPDPDETPASSSASPTAIPSPTVFPVAECVDRAGNEVACAAAEAGLVINNTSPCTLDSALSSFAITPTPQVDLEAESIDETCILFPGGRAADAGGRAADIKDLKAGTKASSLMLCFTGSGGSEVPCSEPHLIEYVGPWFRHNGTTVETNKECDLAARRYAGKTFSSYADTLKVVVVESGDSCRCAIESRDARTDSLWGES